MLDLNPDEGRDNRRLALRRLAGLSLIIGFGLVLWTHSPTVRCKSALGMLSQAMNPQSRANCSDWILINNIGLALTVGGGLVIAKFKMDSS